MASIGLPAWTGDSRPVEVERPSLGGRQEIPPRSDAVYHTLLKETEGALAKEVKSSKGSLQLNYDLHKSNLWFLGGLVGNVSTGYSLGAAATGISDSTALQGSLGLTSTFGFVTNTFGMIQTVKNYNRAKKIGDVWAQNHELAMGARYVCASGATLGAMPLRAMTIMSSQGCKVSEVALKSLGIAVTSLSMGVYGLLGIPYLIRSGKSMNELQGLLDAVESKKAPAEKVMEGLSYLCSMLCLSEEEIEELARNAPTDSTPLTAEEQWVLNKHDRSKLDSIGLTLDEYRSAAHAVAKAKIVKRDQFSKTFGTQVRDKLENEMNSCEIYHGVRSPDKKTRDKATINGLEIIEEAKSAARQRIGMYICVGVICLIGIAAFGLSIAASGGATLLAALIIIQITGLLMMCVDGYELIEIIKSSTASNTDKALLVGVNFFLVGLTIASALLTAGGIPLIIALVGGITYLLIESLILTYVNSKTKAEEKGGLAVRAGYLSAGGFDFAAEGATIGIV